MPSWIFLSSWSLCYNSAAVSYGLSMLAPLTANSTFFGSCLYLCCCHCPCFVMLMLSLIVLRLCWSVVVVLHPGLLMRTVDNRHHQEHPFSSVSRLLYSGRGFASPVNSSCTVPIARAHAPAFTYVGGQVRPRRPFVPPPGVTIFPFHLHTPHRRSLALARAQLQAWLYKHRRCRDLRTNSLPDPLQLPHPLRAWLPVQLPFSHTHI